MRLVVALSVAVAVALADRAVMVRGQDDVMELTVAALYGIATGLVFCPPAQWWRDLPRDGRMVFTVGRLSLLLTLALFVVGAAVR